MRTLNLKRSHCASLSLFSLVGSLVPRWRAIFFISLALLIFVSSASAALEEVHTEIRTTDSGPLIDFTGSHWNWRLDYVRSSDLPDPGQEYVFYKSYVVENMEYFTRDSQYGWLYNGYYYKIPNAVAGETLYVDSYYAKVGSEYNTWSVKLVFFRGTPEPDSTLYFDGSASNQNSYINDTYVPLGVTKDGILDYEIGSYDSEKLYFVNCTSGGYSYQEDCKDGNSFDDSMTSRLGRMAYLPYVDGSESYTFTLWEVDGVDKSDIPWYLFFVEPLSWLISHYTSSTPTYTELDSITINLHAVESIPPDELPDELPDDDPAPEPEPIDPIPKPEPIEIPDYTTNESLSGNYTENFTDSAGEIIGTVSNGTSGTIGFLLSPVRSLTTYVNYANATLADSYNSANSSKPILLAIVPPVVSAIPVKVQKYITFVLVLKLVLILLRWK
ncbi:hypothetical protein V7O62_12300 [Methanolobus sp. ZRKC2]|uniref:hypothetical protein n=1 Tax=Methanolobus sp. ZRKC2 TaxID=3125783 RepID=UPI00325408BA